MSVPDKMIKGVSKLFFSTGEAGEGPLAKNLGNELGAKAIQDALSANKLADDTLELLKRTGSSVHKTTGADLKSLAKENPTASPKELVSLYLGEGTGVTVNQNNTAFNKMQAGQPPSSTIRNYVLLNEGDDNSNVGTGLEGMASPPDVEPRGMGALAPTPTTEGVLVGKGETSAQLYAKDNARREKAKEQFQQSRTNKAPSDPTVQRYAPEVTPAVTSEVPPVDIPGSKFPTKKVVGGAAAAGTVAAALASSGRRGDPDTRSESEKYNAAQKSNKEALAQNTSMFYRPDNMGGPPKPPGKVGDLGPTISPDAVRSVYPGLTSAAANRKYQDDLSTLRMEDLPGDKNESLRKERAAAEDRVDAVSRTQQQQEQQAADGMRSRINTMVNVIPGGARTAGKLERGSRTALAPGGDGTKPPVTKPVTPGKESQAPVTATAALKAIGALAAAAEKGKSDKVSKSSLDELTLTLDGIEKKVSEDPRFQNTPIANNLQSARADAYKMYKEKADRNQLLGTVERAINAIAQFASAQAGFGTRQAGGNLPLSSADYGGQTAQAFKEYETEVGLIGEEQKAGERASDRKEALKEKEITRQRGTILERIKLGSDELKEAGAERRANIAAKLAGDYREATRTSREEAATTKELLRKNKVALGGVAAEIKITSAQMDAINELASAGNKSDRNEAAVKYATLMGIPLEQVNAELGKEDKFFDSDKARSFAAKRATELSENMRTLKAKQTAIFSKISDGDDTVTEATSAVAPTGQAPVSSGTVWRKGKDGILYEYDAVTKKPTGNKE